MVIFPGIFLILVINSEGKKKSEVELNKAVACF